MCFFQTAETGNRTPNSGVKGSGANHYPRAPAHQHCRGRAVLKTISYRHYICLYSLMCEEQHTITYRYRWSMERDFESQCLVSKQVIASPTPPPPSWSNTPCCLNVGPASKTVGNIETALGEYPC